jgi:hypothetical protein
MAKSYTRTLVETTEAVLLISKAVGLLANHRALATVLRRAFFSCGLGSLSTNALILHVSVGKRTTEFATAYLPGGR